MPMPSSFKHIALNVVSPDYSSRLTDLVIELDYLRKKQLGGSTHPLIFFQLKHIFHMLESVGSARIEGNRTTIVEYIETKIGKPGKHPAGIQEIENQELAMSFIEDIVKDHPVARPLVSEIHKKIVEKLPPPPDGEGDLTPGAYRTKIVRITGANHAPPDPVQVTEYMDELFGFINTKHEPKYDLLTTAIAHHRFAWIHPFNNGNGRTARLFTYAMLVKTGFHVDTGRIINPTSVFCCDRDAYYRHLSMADDGTRESMLTWCEYMLGGLRDEIEKIDKLLDYNYLQKEIILPAISYSLERKHITDTEARILRRATEKQILQAGDLKDIFPNKLASSISRNITRLIKNKMLIPVEEGKRKYIIRFDNNYLLRGIIHAFGKIGFLPFKESTER